MLYIAEIDVMPLKELLDPQGRAVASGLQHMQFEGVREVRVGKHITLKVEARDEATAKAIIEDACKKLLHNPVMEYYHFTVSSNGQA
jgi:phosphoribosylformylglycinamidine synthase